MVALSTQRLTLAPHRPDQDTDGIAQVMGDEEVMQHIGLGVLSRDQVADYLGKYSASWAATGMGGWTIRRSHDQTVVGNIFLMPVRDLPPEIEVGYTLGRKFWGMGYAAEALSRVVTYARDERQLKRLIALVRPANTRSSALLIRCGFSLEQVIQLRSRPLELYEISP